jgi:hypothetical protein
MKAQRMRALRASCTKIAAGQCPPPSCIAARPHGGLSYERREGPATFGVCAQDITTMNPTPSLRRAALFALGLTLCVACSDDDTTADPTGSQGGNGAATVPAAPSGLMVSVVGNGMHLMWTDNADDEDHFMVERKDGAGAFEVIATVAFDTTDHHDEPLTSGVTYTYRVAAMNDAGTSAYSNEESLEMP